MAAEDPYIEAPHFYQINRGKRSVCLDLKSEEGMASLETLLGEADVFLSNMRYNSLKSLKLGAEELLERHPHLIVCPMTGWGMEGPESDKPVYDVAGFWARSSAASSHTPRGEYPPILVPGFGDVTRASITRCRVLFDLGLWAEKVFGQLLFQLFQKSELLTMKDVMGNADFAVEPQASVKAALKKICVYHKKGEHAKHYELKPEFGGSRR